MSFQNVDVKSSLKNMTNCPQCTKENKKSRFYPSQTGTSTLAGYDGPYFDEDQRYHNHNPNAFNYIWHCSEGHSGNVVEATKCSFCDFGTEERITIHN